MTDKDEEEEEYAYLFTREDSPQAGRRSGSRMCGR